MNIPVGSPADRRASHTITHALGYAECYHNRCDVTRCVICGKNLEADREYFDTCGRRCWNKLLKLQRERDAAYEAQLKLTRKGLPYG